MKVWQKFIVLLSLTVSVFIGGCDKENIRTKIPLRPVEFTINLTLQEYLPLLNNGGYVYDNRGYKGIIIYRESANKYLAIERACSYEPTKPCERVEVDESGFFLIDQCCGSTFDFYGNPTGIPSSQPLVLYQTSINGHFLTVTNYL